MAEVTGNLVDIGLGHLNGLNPEIIFTLNKPNTNLAGGLVYATRDLAVPVASSGAFTANLAYTTHMRDEAYYSLRVRWQEPGSATGTGYSAVDFHDIKLVVPFEGGLLGALIVGSATNPNAVYVSLTAPPKTWPLMLWLKSDPDDPTNSNGRNTGKIYRWEN